MSTIDETAFLLGVFFAANIIIMLGYVALPFLVMPYLPLTRGLRIFAGGFLVGCAGSHTFMALWMGHQQGAALTFWTVWHVAQAFCTWVFILGFRRMLRAAHLRRQTHGCDHDG